MSAVHLSLGDLVICGLTAGPGGTALPIRIYSEVRLGVKPEINAVCTIMIAVVAAGTIVASLITKGGAARRERWRSAPRFEAVSAGIAASSVIGKIGRASCRERGEMSVC